MNSREMRPWSWAPIVVVCVTVLLSSMGCDGDKAMEPVGSPPADVNAYLDDMPSWETFSPLQASADEAIGDPVVEEDIVDETTYNCETTPYSITRTPDKLVTMNPDSEILWPGALLQGKGYASGLGSLEELPIRDRAPLALSIDILANGNTRTVESPDLASVTQAVGSLIEAAHQNGHTAGSNVLFTQERMHSLHQAMLKVGMSAKYTGVGVETSLEMSVSAERTNVTAYFLQRMFTVSVVLPSTPGAFFSDALTDELLHEQIDRGRIGPDNPPVYISNVAYGRMLMFSFSSAATEAEIRAALNVVLESGGTGGGGELSTDQRALMEEAEIKVVTVGGDAAHALALIRSGNLTDFFASDAPLTSARPISYTVRNLGDNSIAKVSETTEYNLRQCTAAELEVIGSVYEVRMQTLHHIEHAGFPCGGQCPLITSYDFWVQDGAGNEPKAASYDPPVGEVLCIGDRVDLRGLVTREVRLHYDGRDRIRLHGVVRNLAPTWLFDVQWQGTMPTGNLGFSRWNEGFNCSRMAIRINVVRTGDIVEQGGRVWERQVARTDDVASASY